MSKSMLRKSFLAAAAAATAAAVLATFGAAQAAEPLTVEVKAGALRALFPNETDAAAGVYQMSDGRRMELRPRYGVLIADMDGEPVTRLLASSLGSGGWMLRSTDGRMQMRFGSPNGGTEQSVTVTLIRGSGDGTTQVSLAAQTQR